MAPRPRSNLLVTVSVLLLVLFLVALAFHLMMTQRAPALHASGEVQAAIDLLLKVLGSLLLLLLLYVVFSRLARRDQPPSSTSAIDAYQYVVQLLR